MEEEPRSAGYAVRRVHPSASKLSQFVNCTASHLLPQVQVIAEKNTGGSDKHEAKAAMVNERASKASEEAEAFVRSLDWESLHGGIDDLIAEEASVINVKTRKTITLGVDINREYEKALGRPLEKYEIPMSMDLCGLKNAWVPWTRDLKFGLYADEWQARAQGMSLAWSYGASEVDVGFAFVDVATREIREEPYLYYEHELDAWADELVGAFDRLYALEEQLTKSNPWPLQTIEGSWCQYCAALPHCPSKMRLARALIELEDIAPKIEAMTLEQRGRVYVEWKRWKQVLERIGDSMKDLVAHESVPLPNGKILTLDTVRGYEYPGKQETYAMLTQLGATPQQIKGVMRRKADHLRMVERKP